jgi:hypothetical protein
MHPSRNIFFKATSLGMAMALAIASADAAMAADRSLAGYQLAQGGAPTDDQTVQIRSEAEKLAAADVKLEDIMDGIYAAIAQDDGITPDQRAYLKGQVQKAVADWKAAPGGAATTDPDAVERLLTMIVHVGVAVALVIPAVVKVREAAARTPRTLSQRPVVVIEHHR